MRLTDADIRAMRSDEFLHHGPWHRDPEANLRIIRFDLAHLFDQPIEIIEKPRAALLGRFATNLSQRRLWVPRGFADREPRFRAPVLGHEAVHFRGRADYGDPRYNWLYLVRPAYRARFEISSYRESLRIHRAQKSPIDALRQEARRIVRMLRTSYLINVRRDRGIERELLAALLEEIG